MAKQFGPQDAIMYLTSQGYTPYQAAAIAGHIKQESGFNPQAYNPKEGAFGLIQWRESRLQNLQQFAQAQGKDPRDPTVQLDFIGAEMQGPEKKAGSQFLAAQDLPSASAALKGYIRFGDKSDATRLQNAAGFLETPTAIAPQAPMIAGPSAPAPMMAATPTAQPQAAAPEAPVPAPGMFGMPTGQPEAQPAPKEKSFWETMPANAQPQYVMNSLLEFMQSQQQQPAQFKMPPMNPMRGRGFY